MDKNIFKHEPVAQFRPGVQSSEFIRCVVVAIIVFVSQFYTDNLTLWALSISSLCAAFSIARGIFKKSRLAYVGKGERTTEFWVTLAGMVSIGLRWYLGGLLLSWTILGIVICEAGYQLGRGIGKSFIPRDIKLPIGMG